MKHGLTWWLIACVVAGAGCKSGDDDDSAGMAGMSGSGTGGMTASGTGGTTASGTGGMTASGTGGTTASGTGGTTASGTGGTTASGTGGTTASGTGGMTASGTGGMTAGGTGGTTEVMMGMVGDTAAATLAGFGTGTTTGTATFTQNDGNVGVVVVLNDCPDGMHPVHVHQGTSCDTEESQGAHWDMTRGEGIPSVMCTGGTGMAMLMRDDTDPMLAWSVGGDSTTDVIGHVFVAHNEDKSRIACGPIVAQ